ncbi:hypothetical protein [Kitasatospora sp. NPDC005856]|uniref:DUF7878 domain-containing protein n=1 Tax=Kitasatospora sp. NPDC005856 TaxID=3154566 RepID=UPI00340A4FE3
MQMSYTQISTSDLQGTTLADYLVNIEAEFTVTDAGEVIYTESCFPVAELARELLRWISPGEHQAADFLFASISFEDPGAVRIRHGLAGWTVGSMFTPDVDSAPLPWPDLVSAINEFATAVRRDLRTLGIDPAFIGV